MYYFKNKYFIPCFIQLNKILYNVIKKLILTKRLTITVKYERHVLNYQFNEFSRLKQYLCFFNK